MKFIRDLKTRITKKQIFVLGFLCAQIMVGQALSATQDSKLPYKDGSKVSDYKPLDLKQKPLNLEAASASKTEKIDLQKKPPAEKTSKPIEVKKLDLKEKNLKADPKKINMKTIGLNLKDSSALKKRAKPKIKPKKYEIDEFEFDLGFLHSATNQDLSENLSYLATSDIPPGKYFVKTRINRQEIGNFNLLFKMEQKTLVPCLSKDLLDAMTLEQNLARNLNYELKKGKCLSINRALAKGNFDFNIKDMELDLWIPDTLIAKIPELAFDKNKYRSGDNSMFLKYSLQHYSTKNLNNSNNLNFTSDSLNLFAGANMGPLHIRHSSSLNSTNYKLPIYTYGATYAHFDIPNWYSQFYFGNLGTGVNFLSNTSFLGVAMSFDEKMLPLSKQGYAPEIRGFANTNAQVIVKQNDVEIYRTNVARGEFVIKDLRPLSANSDLTLLIYEADSKVTKRIIPYFIIAPLLRKDAYKYKFNFGVFNRGLETLWNEPILMGEFSYGVHNNVSITSGLSLSLYRHEAALALVYNSFIGSFSAYANFAHSHLQKKHYFGASFGASYSNYFSYTKTNLTLAAYRYTMKNFFSLNEVIYYNNRSNLKNFEFTNRLKNNFTLYLGQNLPWNLGNLSFNLSLRNYWNRPELDFYLNLGYSVAINKISLSFNYYRNQDLNSKKYSDTLGMTLSIPFSNSKVANGDFTTSLYLFPNTSLKKRPSFQHSIGISGSFEKLKNSSYSLNIANTNNEDMSLSASGNWRYRKVKLSANFSYNTKNYIQYSFNVDGALVLHKGGVNFVKELGDTFAIVVAKDASGAIINSNDEQKIDANGYGIVPYIAPYFTNRIEIDTRGLPFSYEFKSTGSEIIPANLASPIVSFTANKAPGVFLQLSKTDEKGKSKSLPVGSFVFNSQGEEVGFVGMAGRAYLKAEKLKDTYWVIWGENKTDACYFNLNIPESELLNKNAHLYKLSCNFEPNN